VDGGSRTPDRWRSARLAAGYAGRGRRRARRRCTARRSIAGPTACRLPPHLTVCRRHRLWIGPARTHAGRLDISPFAEILRAQRRHLAQLHHYHWQEVDTAVRAATSAIYQTLRSGTWIPGQRQRLRQLAPGTWNQALADALADGLGPKDDGAGHPVVEIAIYPDVVWLAAQPPRAQHRPPRRILTHQLVLFASPGIWPPI
jgi:hypothetical protein